MSDSSKNLEVKSVHLQRSGKAVLHDLSLNFTGGEVCGIVGPNGSGKSSLLRCLYGYLEPQKGSVLLEKIELGRWEPLGLASHLGVLPQEAEQSLDFTVRQFLALRFSGRSEALENALQGLEFLRLEQLLDSHLSQLSGGERQRVRLGVALSARSPWLLLDEPANHLDLKTQWSLFEYLSKPREGATILALHDLALAYRLCKRVYVLESGSLAATGAPTEVLSKELLREVFGIEGEFRVDDSQPRLCLDGVVSDG